MSKTREERISNYQEQIAQLNNRLKQEKQKQAEEARKQRTKRLIERGAILESLIEDAAELTNDQVKVFLEKTIKTEYARRIFNDVKKQAQQSVDDARRVMKSEGQKCENPASGSSHRSSFNDSKGVSRET
jgi:hypothetical protein